MSLDGFIAGPNGEYDWIVQDPSIDFGAILRQFDTLIMGRGTYELMLKAGQPPASMGMRAFVISTTLRPEDHPKETILAHGVSEKIAALKTESGKDIWLFGGGVLFRSLLDAGLVDSVELGVIPILLGDGIRMLPIGSSRRLVLKESTALPSGILMLTYEVSNKRVAPKKKH